jgi:hypothetical protein
VSRRLGPVLAAALLVRLLPILAADRTVADVLRYEKAARHVLDVSWNPYLAPRLYPYPPLWIWIEAASEWVARATGASFAVVVKLPVLLADLGIVLILAGWSHARWAPDERVAQRAAWLFALHPVSILVTSFHGQFDSVMLFFVLWSLRFQQSNRFDASALSLSGAIATKSFPVLLLPLFLMAPGRSRVLRYVVLATLPVVLLLVPYALADIGALTRELLAYGGVADFGWIGAWRAGRWLATGALARSEAAHWPASIPAAKALFLAVYLAGVWAFATRRLRWTLPQAALATFLAFLTFYGAISAQYLLWPIPLGALLPGLWFALYSVTATAALVGFYLYLAPGVLTAGGPGPLGPHAAGVLWACGAVAVLVAGAAWLADLVRRGRAPA